MNWKILSPAFLVIAVVLFVIDLSFPWTYFPPGDGIVGVVVFWSLFVFSLFFIVLFAAFRVRSF